MMRTEKAIVSRIGRDRRVLIPQEFLQRQTGKKVFFRLDKDGNILIRKVPQGLTNGRFLASYILRGKSGRPRPV